MTDASRTDPEPKFRRRAEARPDEILDAAQALFVEQGFARSSMQDIAQRAGLSKGAVYLYFPSKDAVLEAVVHRSIGPVRDMALTMIEGYQGDPRPLIRQIVTVLARALSTPQGAAVPRIVIHEALTAPAIARVYREEVVSRMMPAMSRLFERAQTAGLIRKTDPEMTVRCVVGPILTHILLDEIFDIRPADGLAIDRMVETHLAILFAGLEPETTP